MWRCSGGARLGRQGRGAVEARHAGHAQDCATADGPAAGDAREIGCFGADVAPKAHHQWTLFRHVHFSLLSRLQGPQLLLCILFSQAVEEF